MRNNYTYLIITLTFLFSSFMALAQETTLDKGKKYTIEEIKVTGIKNFNEQTVIAYTQLRKGQQILIPGKELSDVINRLWKLNLFSDVSFYIIDVKDGDKVTLELNIKELPTLMDVKIKGIKPRKAEKIIQETDLKKGKKVTESFITTTKNFLINKYQKEGYLNAKANIATYPDSTGNNVNMVVNIDKGERVKVKKILFNGNEQLSDKKLRKKMKNTKRKNPLRFYKKSKYIEEDYEEDLASIIDSYKENGFRDARIIKDSVSVNDDNTININIDLEEGNRYYFGDIKFIGNSVYTDAQLSRVFGIKTGDVYNGVELKKRIQDDSKPDAQDLTNLYQNNGYLFSSINAVETAAKNDTIDFEIRVTEGKPAYFNKITVVGNDRTNDHVIFRELRTKPGNLYSKDAVVRSVRELGQLGFFDPEQISPDFKNVNPNDGTVDIEYGVVERGASQIELQGGYGGGGFIGTLGLSFNNFSIRNIFNKEAYKPLPMGDGQKLALRLQASRLFQTYSFSFSEPWLGGKQPVQFSTSLSHTIQFRFDPRTGNANKDERFLITGLSIGLAKRLSVPDDYFTLSQALSFQHYNLKNYRISFFRNISNGFSNNFAYTIALSRNNTATNPIFPTRGSEFNISAKITPPYSLFDGIDYSALNNERIALESQTPTPATQERLEEIDQQRFKWLEYYKVKFKGNWYTSLVDKLVLKTGAEMGYLGSYNSARGDSPFERFYLGGDGLGNFTLDGRENIALRGYENQSLSDQNGSTIYNKFSLELRYPITLKPSASIYALSFLEAGAGFNNFREYNPFDLKRSAGFGLRIFMPAFGLLGIDFGYGFDSDNFANDQLSPSGWQTHFIIGQQF
ncbi:outer membrane protein assembly factor BamA [Sungkyunkwania multivorans]|uniref:Outer membrane protein assembly factor BamA n=1 Tax=Sungkyunkwania multivorans TaxID=1173618 RepID=A0ABW3D1A1_9FLAO